MFMYDFSGVKDLAIICKPKYNFTKRLFDEDMNRPEEVQGKDILKRRNLNG